VRWRGVRAVVRRDLTVVLGSKAVVLPALIVPAVLLVLLPGMAGLAPRFVDTATTGDIAALLELLPDGTLAELADDPALLAAELMVGYLFTPFVLIVPVMYASVIAADAVAGERERGSLEAVLLTPLSDRELVVAKLTTAWLPAAALGVGGAALYALVANLSVGTQVGRLVLPTAEFTIMALWTGPTFAAAALGAVLLVSVRAKTTQEAFQLGGVVILPVVVLIVSQVSGALLLSVWVLAGAGAVALVIAAVLLGFAARALSRTRMGERLG